MAGKPEIARLIEDQSRGRRQRNALLGPKTVHRAFLHPTERRAFVRHLRSSDPDVSLRVLDNRVRAIAQILVDGELPVLPSNQPSCRSDPQAPITRTQQGKDLIVRKLLPFRRNEGNETHAVEPNQTAFGSDPKIAVLGLGKVDRDTRQIAVLNAPRIVAVLGDFSRQVKGQGSCAH